MSFYVQFSASLGCSDLVLADWVREFWCVGLLLASIKVISKWGRPALTYLRKMDREQLRFSLDVVRTAIAFLVYASDDK